MWLVSFSLSSLSLGSLSLSSLSLGSLSLPSPYSHFLPSASYLFSPLHLLPLLLLSTYTRSIYLSLPLPPPSFPSVPSLFYLLHLLPLPFLSISAYTRTLSPTSPALSLPSPAYLLSSTFYPYSSYLYPLPPPPNPALPSLTLPILSPLPLRTKGMRGTLSSLMGRRGGAGDSHIPLTPPRGKSEGRDRNKIPEATYPLWGTSPRVYLWGRVRTWGSEGYFFAFFIPSR